MQQPIYSSRKNLGLGIFLLVGSFIFILPAIYYYHTIFEDYIQLFELFLWNGFVLIGGTCIILPLVRLTGVNVYDDRIELKRWYGSLYASVSLDQLDKVEVIQKQKTYEKVYLYIHGKRYKIYADALGTDGIDELVAVFTDKLNIKIALETDNATEEGIELNAINKKRKNERIAAYFVMSVGLLFALGLLFGSGPSFVKKDEVVIVKGILAEKPNNLIPARGGDALELKFSNYPEWSFSASGYSHPGRLVAEHFCENTQIGDTVLIGIRQSDYDKKIAKTEELSFSDKSFNYRSINPVSIAIGNSHYMTIKQYNYRLKEEDTTILIIVPIIFLGIGTYLLFKNRKLIQLPNSE